VKPLISALATAGPDLVKTSHAVLEHDAGLQPLEHRLVDFAEHPHRVLTLDLMRRVHQPVGQLAIGGEQQQPEGVEVQPSNADPASTAHPRQGLEDRRAALRIVGRAHLAHRLVVDQHPGRTGLHPLAGNQPALVLDPLAAGDPRAQHRRLAIDQHSAVANPLLDLTPRPQPRPGQHFLQFLTLGLQGLTLGGRGGAVTPGLVITGHGGHPGRGRAKGAVRRATAG
jgi:hypothetical protein